MIKTDGDFSSPEAAETAFYSAFAECSLIQMEKVWAKEDVLCVHPNSKPLIGYEAVMHSWKHIFKNGMPPKIAIKLVSRITVDQLAVHMVKEMLSSDDSFSSQASVVFATNIYRKTTHGWQMIEHHGSLFHHSEENGDITIQ